jgi:peptidyl-prolyl cis-trans isomerase D
MFEALRYNLKHNRRGVLKQSTAWFLFGAIIIVFVFWGMRPGRQAGSMGEGGAAAVVNDTTISLARFGEAYENMSRDPRFQQLQALGGDMGRQIMQSQVMQQLISIELIHQQAEKQGLLTTDAEVRDVITGIPAFQDEGKFQRDRYMGYLKSTRKSPGEFENEIRQQGTVTRIQQMFGAALHPLALESEKQKALGKMKAELEFVSVPVEELVEANKIPSADVKAFVADAANATKVKDYFESHKDKYETREQVKARHILIKAKAGDAEAEKKALAKIEDIAKRAKSEDFGKLAKEFSEDPGSKEKGGLLGLFARGQMVKEFEDAAFAANVNSVTAPVKTEYGYHLIQVLEKKPAQSRTFDEVRDEIAEGLMAKDRSRAELEKLQAALKSGDAAAVNKFVLDHKLKWENTGAFSVDAEAIPKIGPSDEAMRLAFSLSADKPLASELVRQGSTAFLLRYKAPAVVKEDAKAGEQGDMMAELMASRRGEDALGQWLRHLEKTATISVNPRFQGGGGGPTQ